MLNVKGISVQKTLHIASLGAVLALTTACGGAGSILSKVDMSTRQVGADIYADVTAQFNTGALVFPTITLPVINPKKPTEKYGDITLRRSLDNKFNEIVLSVNLTMASKGGLGIDCNTLPNGQLLPIAGQGLVCLGVDKGGSKVYLGLSQNSKVIGAAIAIKEFDAVAKFVPGVNLFLPFGKPETVNGVAGVFTGTVSGTSGFGLFMDVTSVVNKTPAGASLQVVASQGVEFEIMSQRPKSNAKHEEVQKRFYELSQKKTKLTVQ